MERYLLPRDASKVDPKALKAEIAAAGISIIELHVGNGVLIFDFAGPLSEDAKTALAEVIAAHNPIGFQIGRQSDN
jgi:hypothetical protein